jgi:putative ABC transport system permease protein
VIFKLFLSKEIKKFPFFFLLLTFNLLIGTLGLTGINIVSDQVKGKLTENAKELLTSDIVVSARRDLLPLEKESLDRVLQPLSFKTYRLVDIYSMVRHERSSQTRLVEIRSFEEGFPFYGNIRVQNGTFKSDGLFISKDLAELWGIVLHDELKIGEKFFTVQGIVTNDSSQGLRGFSLAPRIYLPLALVESTGLLRPGFTGGYARHFLIPDYKVKDFEILKKNLLKALPDAAIKVTLPEESSEQTGKVISYLTDFMSLAALIGLLLSLVGIFYLYQSHLTSRLKDFCLFNLYGLSKRQIIFGLVLQFTCVSIFVFLIQLSLMTPAYNAARPFLSQGLGIELSQRLNFSGLLFQLPFLYGLGITILIPLLLGLMRISLGLQLKASKISLGTFRFYDFLPFSILLWAFAVYLGHSIKIGSLFFLSLLIVFILSTVLIRLIQSILKRFLHSLGALTSHLEIGLAMRNIIHSGHKLTLSFLSLTLGATLISFILQLDSLIQKEFALDEKKPSLFIFDIQDEQMKPLERFAEKKGVELEGITPMIRARLDKVNGKTFTRVDETSGPRTREEEMESRMKNRGINLTYRQDLSPSERIVEGSPFPKNNNVTEERAAFVSLEKRFAQRMGLKIGDVITFDIQGVSIEGIVLNFREVKWTSFYPNFFVNVEPGFIDDAPKTYLAVLPQLHHQTKRSFQRDAVGEFPNISFIDVEELIAKLSDLFQKARQAIEVISWLSLAVGFVILYCLSHDQVYRRYYDLALMKTLGFSSGSLRKFLLVEFGFLFFFATSFGFALGWLIAVLIGHEVFKIPWGIDWQKLIYPGLILSILCLVTILASSWRALKAKPRELLSDS